MRCLLLVVLVVGCGDDLRAPARPDGRPRIDAAKFRDSAEDDSNDTDADMPNLDAPPATLSCTYYCNTLQTACTGGNAQFDTNAQCLASCALLPAGTLGMTLTDTLGCRISHAMTAFGDSSMAAAECPKAGPSGDVTCGTACEAFCDMIDDVCPGQWTAGTCVAQCTARGTILPGAHYNTGTTVQSGDTGECRLYWAINGDCNATKRTGNSICN